MPIGGSQMQLQVVMTAKDRASATLQRMSGTMGGVKKALLGIGVAAGAAAVVVGVKAVKAAVDYEEAMYNVQSIAKLSTDEFKNMYDAVLELSKTVPQSAKEMAEGLYDIYSSGFAGAEAMKILEVAAKGASAGMTDTATSSRALMAVMNAYNMKTGPDAVKIMDILFKTVDKGVITFEELAGSMGMVVSNAAMAGISIEDMGAAIGFLTIKGLPAALATTALNRLITSIISPSEEFTKVLGEAGYESGQLAIQEEGLVGVMGILRKEVGGNALRLRELITEERGVRAAGALLGSTQQELTEYFGEFTNSIGATQTALDEQSKSLAFQYELLKGKVNVEMIKLGTQVLPHLSKAILWLTETLIPLIQTHWPAIKDGARSAGQVFKVLWKIVVGLKNIWESAFYKMFRITNWFGKNFAKTIGWVVGTIYRAIYAVEALLVKLRILKREGAGTGGGGGGGGAFQAGGVVPGTFNQPVPIIAHGGESIRPAGITAEQRPIEINMTINGGINNMADVKKIGEQIGRQIELSQQGMR